eukprot:GHVL01013742.1.p2 GENE.GHVL01013742.1~~GHVL01013742.1.p2  ORF type:complete len:295 (-),score=49.78 GHVL01013742.1:1366-2250(-)
MSSDILTKESEKTNFCDLGLSDELVKALKTFKRPSPVQIRSIVAGINGSDLIIQSKSGTGKTVAFACILLSRICTADNRFQSMVVAPTREVAIQDHYVIKKLSEFMIPPSDVQFMVGGTPVVDDVKSMKDKPPHVIVGTPGRLEHFFRLKAYTMTCWKILVMDEADNLLDEGLVVLTRKIFRSVRRASPKIQVLAVSATFLPRVLVETETLLARPPPAKPPLKIFLCSSDPVNKSVENPVLKLVNHYCLCLPIKESTVSDKIHITMEILFNSKFDQAIIFCNDSQGGDFYKIYP